MRRILFDHCVPRPFRNLLVGCTVSTANEMGWTELKNGELLDIAEAAGFAVLITSDKNLRYQQNLSVRRIAIIELPTNRLRMLTTYASRVNELLPGIPAGAYEFIVL